MKTLLEPSKIQEMKPPLKGLIGLLSESEERNDKVKNNLPQS